MTFKFHVDSKPWLGGASLYVEYKGYDRQRKLLVPAQFTDIGSYIDLGSDKPFLSHTREQKDDGLADADDFLQAALDCAWERGMRPTGFKDFANELSAVRYHLEDMRTLVLKPAKVPE